jgi:hypothetical protein
LSPFIFFGRERSLVTGFHGRSTGYKSVSIRYPMLRPTALLRSLFAFSSSKLSRPTRFHLSYSPIIQRRRQVRCQLDRLDEAASPVINGGVSCF